MEQQVPNDGEPNKEADGATYRLSAELERVTYLAAQIALLKAKIENTKHIHGGLGKHLSSQEQQLASWIDELESIKEGQMLLGIE